MDPFLACFNAMGPSYLQQVDREEKGDLAPRTASLLPALFLARIDGKSPVECITRNTEEDKVRRYARDLRLGAAQRLLLE